MKTIIIVLLLSSICFMSCDKVNDEIDSKNVDFLFEQVRYYPPNQIMLRFVIDLKDIQNTYSISWNSPDSLNGTGPFELISTNDILLDCIISDVSGNQYNLQKNIIFDTIKNNPVYDYRNIYLGNYLFTGQYTTWYFYQSVPNNCDIIDTLQRICYKIDSIDQIGVIQLFKGYTTNEDSNYKNKEFKIDIIYKDISFDHDHSRCGWVSYFTNGYIHPTVDLYGNLSYPEL